MNSGKSTQLLQAHYNYLERGMFPVALTAKIDTRTAEGVIAARIGLQLPAYTFDENTDIFNLIKTIHDKQTVAAVLIDEAHFLKEKHVFQCAKIVDDLNIPVLCYGLKADFLGKLFEGSEALLRLADNIEEIKTICWCGKKATQNARIDENGNMVREGEQIVIGGNDMYISLCRKHFLNGQSKPIKGKEKG